MKSIVGTIARRRVLSSVVVMLVLSMSAPAQKQTPLRWGADPSGGAPYVFIDPAHPDKYIGYEKEMVEALAAALDRRPELIPADWETIVPALERGAFDVIVNGLEPTADRAQYILFSRPYYVFQLQLSVRRDDARRVLTLGDCREQKLTVGTLANTAASRLMEKEGVTYKGYADPVGAYRDLELRRLDAVLMDVPMEMYYARRNERLRRAGAPFHRGVYVVGLRRGDEELKKQIDDAIVRLARDGTLERILRRWDLWNDEQSALLPAPSAASDETGEAASPVAYDLTSTTFNWGEALARLARAALVTMWIAVGAMAIALVLGLPLALGQWAGPRWLRLLCTVYVEFFRGTPVLVQLLFLYFGLPKLGLTMPGWLTALIGLGLNYAAYESQIYRAALDGVPRGQWEVSYLLGMSPALAFRRVILPQAFRTALPPMTNDFVALFKDTSVAFAISVWELATAYRELANASGEFLLLGAIVAAFYLAMSLPLAHLARSLEVRMRRRSHAREGAAHA